MTGPGKDRRKKRISKDLREPDVEVLQDPNDCNVWISGDLFHFIYLLLFFAPGDVFSSWPSFWMCKKAHVLIIPQLSETNYTVLQTPHTKLNTFFQTNAAQLLMLFETFHSYLRLFLSKLSSDIMTATY